ncbi:MAG: capsule assembly Wzi family protein [bacterium]
MKRKVLARIRLVPVFFILLSAALSGPLSAQTNVPLGSGTFADLEWLAALGYLPSFSAGIRPISRDEAAILVLEGEKNARMHGLIPGPLVISTLAGLRHAFRQEIAFHEGLSPGQSFLKPIESIRITCRHQDIFTAAENDYGRDRGSSFDMQGPGSGGRQVLLDWEFRGQIWNRLGFFVQPFWSIGHHSDHDDDQGESGIQSHHVCSSRFEFTRGYMQSTVSHFRITIGKESLWWGQGTHGTLQLTNNARPFKLICLSSRAPFVLPSILQPLGLARFSFFYAELEKDRPYDEDNNSAQDEEKLSHPDIHKPKFSGLAISLKINPRFECGLIRTFLFRRGNDFPDALLARHENRAGGPGNQQMGVNWRITLPLDFQALTLYGEHAGEDEAHLCPSNWAHLAGIFLPSLGPLRQLRFRAEYASTHAGSNPAAWYTHAASREGLAYSSHDRIMGHHMGTDADDTSLSLEWEPLAGLRIRPAIDYERGWSRGEVIKKQRQFLMGLEYAWSSSWLIAVNFCREFWILQESAQFQELVREEIHGLRLADGDSNTTISLSLQLMF